MNLELAKQIEQRFPHYLSYGIMPNPNEKYRKQGYRTLLVAVFPYYNPYSTGIFSKYCSVYDYHTVVKEEFAKIFEPLSVEYLSFSDISPFPEKLLAQELGLGQIGKNNLLLTEKYASFVFIGEALLKEELPERKHNISNLCDGCNLCVKACPNQALDNGFCREKCLSYLSQKKALTPQEETELQKSKAVWGCDLCQLACPYVKTALLTDIEKFQKPILKLEKEEILSLTDAEFREKYREFAFSYKGIEILKRNVRLIHE